MESSTSLEIIQRHITELAIVPDYRIDTSTEAVVANDQLSRIKTLDKELAAAKEAELRPLLTATKEVRDRFRPAEDLLSQAEKTVKGALLGFQRQEAERIARERAEAEAKAAQERARLEEEARKAREKAEAKAEALRAAGKSEKAEAVLAEADAKATAAQAVAAMVSGAVAPAAAPTELKGFSSRSKWKGVVADPRKLLMSLASRPELDPTEFIQFKQTGLDKLASLYKGATPAVLPGLTAQEEQIAAARAA